MLPSTRLVQRTHFLEINQWHNAECEPLPSDASFRRYFRLRQGQHTVLLMDAPPPLEAVMPFVMVSQHLLKLGFSAPRIIAVDGEKGFILLEDFGNATYTRLLATGNDELELYTLAIKTLIALHRHPNATAIPLLPYDETALLQEAALFVDWYLPYLTGQEIAAAVRADYCAAWQSVLRAMPPADTTLVLRDYHIDNLMLLPQRAGIQRCGLLDFQDALLGNAAYDVVSLLEDARRDITPELQRQILSIYFNELPEIHRDNFMQWYRVLGTQRHCKVAGIFVRLCRRDGKTNYLQHIPRVINLLHSHLNYPYLQPLQAWMQRYVLNASLL